MAEMPLTDNCLCTAFAISQEKSIGRLSILVLYLGWYHNDVMGIDLCSDMNLSPATPNCLLHIDFYLLYVHDSGNLALYAK